MINSMEVRCRYSPILVEYLRDDLRAEFFDTCATDSEIEAGWRLFEMVYPELAPEVFSIVSKRLDDILEELAHQRVVNALLGEGKKRQAAMLDINFKASKLEW